MVADNGGEGQGQEVAEVQQAVSERIPVRPEDVSVQFPDDDWGTWTSGNHWGTWSIDAEGVVIEVQG